MQFICCLFGFELRYWNFVVKEIVEDPHNEVALVENPREALRPRAKHIRVAFAKGIRRRHFGPFPAIRSKLCAITKAFHCYPGYFIPRSGLILKG